MASAIPDRAIDESKRVRMVRCARDFARHAGVAWENVRFDIVTVVFKTPPAIVHLRDVLNPNSRH